MSEQSYIIRIYRCVKDERGTVNLSGLVEIPESGTRIAFHDSQDLWAILVDSSKSSVSGKRTRNRKQQGKDK